MKLLKSLTAIWLLTLFTAHLLYSQGYLHRCGRYICDGSGNEIILRGIGTGNWMLQEGYMMQTSGVAGTQHEFRAKLEEIIGREKTDSFYTVWLDSHFRRIDVDSMKSWGFNSVRVAMHYKWFTPPVEEEPVPGEITWLDKGFTMIDSLLGWCGDNEMYLILDLHGAPGGQGKDANISDYDPSKPSLWESQANKDKTVALWRKLAERYSGEPWMGGYDLINETNWTFPEGNNSPLRELMVNITNAIREVDRNHIIFIEGNGFANDFSGLTPPWDDNMVYSFHKYWNYTSQESISFALNLRNTHNVPIWMGESGENSNVWFTGAVELFEKNRIGWSWWPVKKPGLNNPLKVTVNEDYTRLVNYWRGSAPRPEVDDAFNAVLQFAQNHRLENCRFQKDVVDALIRQPHTAETIPFKLYHTGEPVFAVDYNLGRSACAYLDNDSANYRLSTGVNVTWNQGYSYRNDGVDIQPCEDNDVTNGFNVGWTGDGEWMEYTVVCDSTAGYTLSIRSASGSGGAKVHLETDRVAITPLINLPGTAGWQNWQTTNVQEVILPKGTHKVRWIFDRGGSNLNYFKFSGPVPVENIGFKSLYAESSEDGKYILLSLNKPVTSAIGEANPEEFSVTCDEESLNVNTVTLFENNPYKLRIDLEGILYYGGIIRISYQGNTITSNNQQLENFIGAEVSNKLPFRFTIPARIQAEDYSYNNGFVSESCSDTGGGLDMGYANPGDYLDYRIHVPESRYYTFYFRIATIRASSRLIIQVGEEQSFVNIDTLVISSTGGWQNWETISTKVLLNEGRYTLRLYISSGEFNTNWFQIVAAEGLKVNEGAWNDLRIYPNPAGDYIYVDLTGLTGGIYDILIFNALGQPLKNIRPVSLTALHIETSDMNKGLHFIMVRRNNILLSSSKLLIM